MQSTSCTQNRNTLALKIVARHIGVRLEQSQTRCSNHPIAVDPAGHQQLTDLVSYYRQLQRLLKVILNEERLFGLQVINYWDPVLPAPSFTYSSDYQFCNLKTHHRRR